MVINRSGGKPNCEICVRIFILLCLLVSGCKEAPSVQAHDSNRITEPPAETPPSGPNRLRTVYVPAYSHLPFGPNDERRLFSILLSIRNVDSNATVTLTHVDYFDTSGQRVRQYLKQPRKLRPLETVEFKVETLDDTGGSGANFLVYWEGPSDTHSLLTESIMWGHVGSGYSTFTSRGIELDRRPSPAILDRNRTAAAGNINETDREPSE